LHVELAGTHAHALQGEIDTDRSLVVLQQREENKMASKINVRRKRLWPMRHSNCDGSCSARDKEKKERKRISGCANKPVPTSGVLIVRRDAGSLRCVRMKKKKQDEQQ
jgi:hypothetical protein